MSPFDPVHCVMSVLTVAWMVVLLAPVGSINGAVIGTADGNQDDQMDAAFDSKADAFKDDYRVIPQPGDFRPKKLTFSEWINSTHTGRGPFFDHGSVAEGEVLLFRTKKNRHRAIPVMRATPNGMTSKFDDSLTFREWLRKTYPDEKAIRVTVRSTDVVRPVLQHLYAARHDFTAPVIVHANTFASRSSVEKPVDPVIFVDTVSKLLPESTISLGWTPSRDYAALNRLDWSRAFKLMSYTSNLQQPVMLTMNLNDALHSLEQLEWLLGIREPEFFVLVRADASAFVDAGVDSMERLAGLADGDKVLFDVDDAWKKKLKIISKRSTRKRKRSVVHPEEWTNLVFPRAHSMLSTSIVSKTGVAFLGWPNALLLSNHETQDYPSKQVITGKVMFLPKRSIRHITPEHDSGMILQLFDKDRLVIDSPTVSDTIKIFIGYDGRITIKNDLRHSNPLYSESSSSQLPKSGCYDFRITDRGWRVDAEVATTECAGLKDPIQASVPSTPPPTKKTYQTFVSLDTPISRQRRLRSVGVTKSGDGAIDFLVTELEHSSAWRQGLSLILLVLSCLVAFVGRLPVF
uniref:CAP10 domain-containing protein n=1 Tax=Panagrellus redivivus TaxID=6233 RepID=A0A7E4ZVC5_PANRE